MPYHGDVRGIAIGDTKVHSRIANLRGAVPDLTWDALPDVGIGSRQGSVRNKRSF